MDQDKLNQQSDYWEANFSEKPMMFGLTPSEAALSALKIFKKENIKEIVELGAGLGRDTIFFAKNKIKVDAFDYSQTAVKIIDLPIIFLRIGSFVKYFPKNKASPNKIFIIVGFT